MTGLALRPKVLITSMGLLILFGAQCDHEKPTGHSKTESGTIHLEVLLPDSPVLPERVAGAAKAAIAQGRLRVSGEGMSPRDTVLAVQAGRLRARIDGIPVGLRTVALILQESISDTLFQATSEVTVVAGTPATAVLVLQRVGDTAPEVGLAVTPEVGGVRTDFVLQAQVSDLHDATDSLEVRWDFDNDGVFEVDWTLDKDASHTFGSAGNFRIALQVRDLVGKENSLTRVVQVLELLAQAGSNAGPDTLAARLTGEQVLVPLDGSASKGIQGKPLIFHWQVLDYPQNESASVAGTFTDNNSATASRVSFEPKAGRGLYVLILQVEDESTRIESEPDTLYVNVFSALPVASVTDPGPVMVGQTVTLQGQATDADDAQLQYRWRGNRLDLLSDTTSSMPVFAPQQEGVYRFTLVGIDGDPQESAPTEVPISVETPVETSIPRIGLQDIPVIDGDLSDWEARFASPHLTQSHFLSTSGDVQGPVPEDDQKVVVWLGWNAETNLIYLAARVVDNAWGTTSSDDPATVYRSDAMEVYIDADNSGGPYDWLDAHAQQYVLNPSGKYGAVLFAGGAPPALVNPPNVTSAARRSGSMYTYELAIPGWDSIDQKGNGVRHDFQGNHVIGLTLVFADYESTADANAGRYHAFNGFYGPVGAFGDADQFSDFLLK